MYSVSQPPTLRPRGIMGEVDYAARIIKVSSHSSRTGKAFKQEDVDDTFWHELTHAILYEMDSSLYNNEAFVGQFASMLTKAINSAKF